MPHNSHVPGDLLFIISSELLRAAGGCHWRAQVFNKEPARASRTNNVTPEECHRVSSHPGVTHAAPSACPLLSDTRNPRLHWADDVKFCVAVKGLFALARHSTLLSVHDLTLLMENPRDPRASANNTSLKLFLHLLQGGIHYISRLRVPVSEWGRLDGKQRTNLFGNDGVGLFYFFLGAH